MSERVPHLQRLNYNYNSIISLQVTKTITSRTVKQSGAAPVTTTTTVVETNGKIEDIFDEEILKKLVCVYN